MIYEVRTYRLKPRMVPAFIKAFGEAYENGRKQLSPLAAFFYSEVGPLNEVMHIWAYKDLAEREAVRTEAVATGVWPPAVTEMIHEMNSEVFTPFPFMGEFLSGEQGPLFEYRYYTVNNGTMPGIIKGWEDAIGPRCELSPCAMAMHTDLGNLNKYVHIWPYESFEHRAQVRADGVAKGVWPPKGSPKGAIVTPDNKLLLAPAFSPLR
ncbi:MAG: NIPSNAP family protein [Rhodospirillaceae bacterium]|jgi:hypothetical protein|nr:NIPSNAP family protein [Rhodospirillaceae bacterium]MBT3810089.1 NIPSNAP family protein [Rhodospirillaceae bacterium]MBT3929166.1 NIPSNAP family protein [Rhodospirillaceae bacterium]MBT4773075.1 NIPSNAP family protein [Rhodospirillaceae bacterium]MBT5358776.1 NIPSNAP family protein [Rhodospirillaceae bacterium]